MYICKVLQNDILATLETLNPQQELEKFVNFCVEKHGKYVPTEEQKVSLDFEYRDVFLSIEDAMAVTKEMDANATIPYIVPLLCEKVKEFNGFHNEGIFRKSASKAGFVGGCVHFYSLPTNKNKQIKLRMKNFTFEEQNVHIFANCLKT
ncbi:hypothetical protein RFI_38497 [Reticulomyxa filosa]|uniref:Rho-GAP domain-containing protein n=1 Tax=Reticulomyxa filosa TaxID=46433 RepID=X6LCC0_RETFI|nr:hypothetical protein RFI_38497 [Reticulomyxa filosa]|eukprot:ETN98990.1 hypothetical protein RFI_38497 [Reticulomyxa filosa]